ncbi:homeobox-leucine zipper protein HOX12-like [Canna indica]|uniref:Homeobox-leucine zipper protein n=1 Tax=Canna indica TaxID=4628 RepID=A0AAQ3L4W2_9LILI|nr:homeobox-leucine zipper protein HOX12-like [Canna indica]
MSRSRMAQVEKKMAFPSLLASELGSQLISQAPASEARARRRRRKAKEAEAKKRRLSDDQVKFLETSFKDERKLESGRKVHLAAEIGLDPKQVAVWFQNRRARHKSKQVEEAFVKLKTAHDAIVVEKCYLENELMSLKEKLSEAEEEIRKLSLGFNGTSSGGSPSSSFTAVSQRPYAGAGEFGVKGEDDGISMHEYNFNNYMTMEWANNFYGV